MVHQNPAKPINPVEIGIPRGIPPDSSGEIVEWGHHQLDGGFEATRMINNDWEDGWAYATINGNQLNI